MPSSPLPHGSNAHGPSDLLGREQAIRLAREVVQDTDSAEVDPDGVAVTLILRLDKAMREVPSPGVRASEKEAERSGAPASEAEGETDQRTREVVEYVATTLDGALHIHRGTGICEPINPEDLVVHVLSQAGFHTLLRERDEAREALGFYAKPRNHRGIGTSPVHNDRGRTARCALGDECGRCHGHGLVWNPAVTREEFCPDCHGEGYLRAAGSEEENR